MGKKILVSTEDGETRVAVLEGKVLDQVHIERKNQARLVGNVYKGRVKSVVSGIQAAFVDIGLQKQGFLYISDVIPPQEDVAEMLVDGYDEAAKRSKPAPGTSINKLLKNRQSNVVIDTTQSTTRTNKTEEKPKNPLRSPGGNDPILAGLRSAREQK